MSKFIDQVRKTMVDLYIYELGLLDIIPEKITDYSIKFKLGDLGVYIYPKSEDIYCRGEVIGNGLGFLKEFIMTDPIWRKIQKDKKIKAKNKRHNNVVFVCPNMDEYEQLLIRLGYIYEKRRNCLKIIYKNKCVTIYPKSGWFTGKSVQDGRGMEFLEFQLQN